MAVAVCPDDEHLNNLGQDSYFVDILKGKAEGSYSLSLTSVHNIRKKIHYVFSFFDFPHRTPKS